MLARHSVATELLGRHSLAAAPSGLHSEDADSGMASDLGSVSDLGSDSAVALDSADAGDVVGLAGVGDGVSASAGAGIRGGDGDIRTIHTRTVPTRIGEVMAVMAGTTILRRTVRT
jgi:hypothetical protein